MEESASGPAARFPLVSMTGVLFTCAGARVDIVTSLRPGRRDDIATDINPLAPALYHADRYSLLPRVDDPAYVELLQTSSARTTSGSSSR